MYIYNLYMVCTVYKLYTYHIHMDQWQHINEVTREQGTTWSVCIRIIILILLIYYIQDNSTEVWTSDSISMGIYMRGYDLECIY